MFVRIAIEVRKMSQFHAEKFVPGHCEDACYDLKKDELISVATLRKQCENIRFRISSSNI